jgi:hypothetical protein
MTKPVYPPTNPPCGCAICGCLCADHSPDRAESLCAAHVDKAVFAFIAGEAAALVSLTLFVAMVAVWAGYFSRL